ncbi:hypothetical protein GGR54DRAFT_123311 [Hypoxylon sp. NC1633]|nr:hypothetical protein GGR54DRAFT_123311 [Hypoxylon sp. NC1633]
MGTMNSRVRRPRVYYDYDTEPEYIYYNNNLDYNNGLLYDEDYVQYGWPEDTPDVTCCSWCHGPLEYLFMGPGEHDMPCCPWCEGPFEYADDQESWLDWATLGIFKRRGCNNRNHWTLAFRSSIDIHQLPRSISGIRTRNSSPCGRTCGGRGRRRELHLYPAGFLNDF